MSQSFFLELPRIHCLSRFMQHRLVYPVYSGWLVRLQGTVIIKKKCISVNWANRDDKIGFFPSLMFTNR